MSQPQISVEPSGKFSATRFLENAKRFEELKLQADQKTAELDGIRSQIREVLDEMRGSVPDYEGNKSRSAPVSRAANPRPLEDRLSISAGRAVVAAKKANENAEQARTRIVTAVEKLAKSLGLAAIPAASMEEIERKIAENFSAAPAHEPAPATDKPAAA